MRTSMAVMDQNHQQIVEEASRLFRERGIDSTSVSDVMAAAGLTHGGFYRHFESKDALAAEAIALAFDAQLRSMSVGLVGGDLDATLLNVSRVYLDKVHVGSPGNGCPLPAIGVDVSRGSDATKEAFSEGVNRVIELLASAGVDGDNDARKVAAKQLALLVGAVVLARACDPKTSNLILRSARG
jgi:TetR/AcrR family transcriptional repressor of nem operon